MKQRIITAVIALLALLYVLFYAPQEIALGVIIVVMLAGDATMASAPVAT